MVMGFGSSLSRLRYYFLPQYGCIITIFSVFLIALIFIGFKFNLKVNIKI